MIFGKLKAWLYSGAILIAFVFSAFIAGMSKGKRSEKLVQDGKDLAKEKESVINKTKAATEVNNAKKEVNALNGDAANDVLKSDWVRREK